MSNQAYLSIWCKDFSEAHMLEQFGALLATVPFSAIEPGFSYLVIRAVDSTESPVLEQDLRAVPLDASGVIEIAKDHLNTDCAYELRSNWDLWTFDDAVERWQLQPQPLELFCHGEDYDDGFWREFGHLEMNLGFEHFFTGHAGLLGYRQTAKAPPQSPEEARFLAAMKRPENLRNYQEKTVENIRRLLDWVRRIEKAVAVDRLRLWSEGEENFEARIEEILAARSA
jgi:hypothetical protein